MYLISHIALFYISGKSIKIKKLWIGMIASIIPDIALILFWIGQAIGLDISYESSHPLNLFLHSIFPIILLIPLLIFGRGYFYSALAGYSFHLFLDFLTHTTIRMPLYPISNWKIPIFLISYFDIVVIFLTSVIICGLFLILYRKNVITIFRYLLDNFHKKRVSLFVIIYSIISFLLGIIITFAIIKYDPIVYLIFMPIITINLFFSWYSFYNRNIP